MRKQMLAVAVMVFGFSGAAQAESYVSAYLGAAIPHEADIADSGLTGTIDFNSGVTLGAKLGQWFNDKPSVGLQVDLNGHYPDLDSITVNGLGTAPVSGDISVTSITANALVRVPDGKMKPYAGIGLGFFSAEVDSVDLGNDDDTAFGWQLLAGVDIEVAPKFSIFGEYKYSAADFRFSTTDVEYSASQIYGGASFHF